MNKRKRRPKSSDKVPEQEWLMRAQKQSRTNLIDGKESVGSDDDWAKSRQLIRPDDQLDLTENDLSEEIKKVLSTENPNVPKNLVIYSFKEGSFVEMPPPPNIVTLFQFDGTSLHLDSDEAKKQIEEMGDDYQPPVDSEPEDAVNEIAPPPKPEGGDDDGEGAEDAEADEDEPAAAAAVETPAAAKTGGKKRLKLINQFNYCERAAITYNNPSRNVDTQTIPPPRSSFASNVKQWVIYDSYALDFEQNQKDKEKDKKHVVSKKDSKKKADSAQASHELNKKYLQCWQILERMINQNIFDDIAQDYRYYEDPSDEFREEEGTLLPLWKFSYEKTKKMHITDMCFNTLYYDLFAVCYGSLDFLRQQAEGGVCLFTIKNPSFPDYRITTESGVMCCDIHPKYPYLLVIGMYDGNVAVYNLQTNPSQPLYVSKGVNCKHSDVIWEMKWGPDMPDGEINFYSVSADGRVFNWVLMQNKLSVTTIITLYLDKEHIGNPDGTDIQLKACGTCMIFHPKQPEIFLVGTEEGLIYNDPLFIFDLGASVGDVKWAPYSSTVLAAVTTEGKVYVFDINVNKYKAICVQQVVPRKSVKLTCIAFNQKLPFIIVGDDKGMTTSLKLSPNLRLKVKPPKKQQNVDQDVLQLQKLEKLLSLVRELPDDEELEKEAATTVAS
ncbi:Dynein intermediate chain 2, ciliary [Pseudolycoriella hygida]|uniref:Dynein intermediate chain 2, ciliary n=1 Tax=Pseudolycoriella hygida TaxID=35572 RepID=A0A9Q0N4G1_9DIPT|nr:Dynein intermediate chain 2, ciliary [Pseudolycoriella hygida]